MSSDKSKGVISLSTPLTHELWLSEIQPLLMSLLLEYRLNKIK
jgi:hypothetical protein